MVSRWMASLALVLGAATAQAVPVTVTQTFSNVTWDFEGYTNSVGFGQAISGDWVFKATLDSEAPREFSFGDIGAAYGITDLTLTQASLGLFDAQVLNIDYLYFHLDRVGFAYSWLVYPDTSTSLPSGTIHPNYGPNPFANGFTTTAGSGNIRPRDEGFLFADGSRLFGVGTGASSTIGAAVAPVPEPETWLAMIAGLGVLVGRFAKKRAQSSQPAMAAA